MGCLHTFCCWDIWILDFCWRKHKRLPIKTFSKANWSGLFKNWKRGPFPIPKSKIGQWLFFSPWTSHWPQYIGDKVFKNGSSKTCGRQPLKNLLGSFLNTFSLLKHLLLTYMWIKFPKYFSLRKTLHTKFEGYREVINCECKLLKCERDRVSFQIFCLTIYSNKSFKSLQSCQFVWLKDIFQIIPCFCHVK